MKSELTLLAATLFAAAALTVPAEALTVSALTISNSTYSLSDTVYIGPDPADNEVSFDSLFGDSDSSDTTDDDSSDDATECVVTITNGGVLALGSSACTVYGDVVVTISGSSYLVSQSAIIAISDDSSAAITGDGTGTLSISGGVEISFDADYLAGLVTGTATEYTYQIFDSAVLSNSSIEDGVTVDDSWSDTDGIASVSYNESTGTVTVTTVAVPEPSAFGMLAGIAVLVFVAARRTRRSRKVA